MNIKDLLRQLDHGTCISETVYAIESQDLHGKSIGDIVTIVKESAAQVAAMHADEFPSQLVDDHDDWLSLQWERAGHGLTEGELEQLWAVFAESVRVMVAERGSFREQAAIFRLELDKQIDILETEGMV